MNRRAFVTGLGAVLAAPVAADAQQASGGTQRPGGKLPRVGYLGAGNSLGGVGMPYLTEAFREGLRESGYVERQNVIIEFKFAEQRYEDCRNWRQSLCVLASTLSSRPVTSQRIVPSRRPSLSRPGGTGLTQTGTQVTGKRLSLLKEALVKLSRVAVLSNPTAHTHHLSVSRDSARELALKLLVFEARIPRDIEGAFLAMVKDRAQALLLLPDSIFYQMHEHLGRLALRHRLPMIGWRPDFARSGALLAYGAELSTDHRRGGALVGKILGGAKVSDLPVEEPSKLELVINLKTAKALGLTIPRSLLLRADQVIE